MLDDLSSTSNYGSDDRSATGGTTPPRVESEIASLLLERGKTHGNYDDNARCSMLLVEVLSNEELLRLTRGQPELSVAQHHSLMMIVFKIARIVTGQADFKDHWDDIAGYAKLIADRCKLDDEVLATTFGPKENYVARTTKHPACACFGVDCDAERGTEPKYVYCRRRAAADQANPQLSRAVRGRYTPDVANVQVVSDRMVPRRLATPSEVCSSPIRVAWGKEDPNSAA